MATQIFIASGPSNEYCVIDPTGASQDTNPFTNGTVPDCALVPTFSPLAPIIVQKANAVSTGTPANLQATFPSNTTAGNTIIVVAGTGGGSTFPTTTDTQNNPYNAAAQRANGSTFNASVMFATNIVGGADSVTISTGGVGSLAMEIYEVANISPNSAQDSRAQVLSGANTSSPAASLGPQQINEFSVVAFSLGTAAQTITVAAGYTNDSGQLNPTTPSGLFSFVSASTSLSTLSASSPSATVGVAEPWAVAAATFRTITPATTLKTGTVILDSPLSTRLYFKNPA